MSVSSDTTEAMTAPHDEAARVPRDARKRFVRKALFARASPLVVIVGVLLIWELCVRLFNVPAYLLPPPSAIARRIVVDYKLVAINAWVTLGEVLAGYGLAIVVSIPLAAILSQFRVVENAIYPTLVASQTIPKVAIAPILVVWFGFGLLPKILIAFLICFFPIVVDTMTGFRSVPREVIWLARSMGAPQWKTFAKIRIPAALPNIFAGLKVASTLAVVGAVVGEFIGADRGLGYQLIVANGLMDVQLSFAVLVALSLLGIVLYAAIDLLERLALPWHVSHRLVDGAKTTEAS
ncbi:MAG TPA: ABC transporter permease [Casimicrobiaceae bacterium]|nr:ABC transporter permease [Casimicrobiaceae bacterium]